MLRVRQHFLSRLGILAHEGCGIRPALLGHCWVVWCRSARVVFRNDGNCSSAVGRGFVGGIPEQLSPRRSIGFVLWSGCRTEKQVRGSYACRLVAIPHTTLPPFPPSNEPTERIESQDGDSSKTSESSSVEEKSSEASFPPDSANHLVAIDIKWFVSLHRTLLRARDALVFSADMIEKNKEKILRPKGNNPQGGGMMF